MKKNEAFGFNYVEENHSVSVVYIHRNSTFKTSDKDIVFYTDMTNDEVLGIAIKIADDFYPKIDISYFRKYDMVLTIFYNFMYAKNCRVKKDKSNTKHDTFEVNKYVGKIVDEYLKINGFYEKD